MLRCWNCDRCGEHPTIHWNKKERSFILELSRHSRWGWMAPSDFLKIDAFVKAHCGWHGTILFFSSVISRF